MTVEEMPLDRLKETLLALRRAARLQPDGRRSFAHDKIYRAAFVHGILLRRNLIRKLEKNA
jgi:hypothetical protein